jgi:N-acetylmuramoyl-L-alanine amidase
MHLKTKSKLTDVRLAAAVAKELLASAALILIIVLAALMIGAELAEPAPAELSEETQTPEETQTEEESVPENSVSPVYDKYAHAAGERELLERIVAGEARGEPYEGMIAVAEVVLNRAALWDMTPMEVMTSSGFYTGYDGPISDDVRHAVTDALAGIKVFNEPVTHFHEASITPYWAKSKTFVMQLGNHKFFY